MIITQLFSYTHHPYVACYCTSYLPPKRSTLILVSSGVTDVTARLPSHPVLLSSTPSLCPSSSPPSKKKPLKCLHFTYLGYDKLIDIQPVYLQRTGKKTPLFFFYLFCRSQLYSMINPQNYNFSKANCLFLYCSGVGQSPFWLNLTVQFLYFHTPKVEPCWRRCSLCVET